MRQIIGSFAIFTFWFFLWLFLTILVVYRYILPRMRVKRKESDVLREAVVEKKFLES